MFFNRNKTDDQSGRRVGLTDGIEPKIAEFVKDWGALQRGEREFVADRQEEPLKLLTDADVAYFVKAMEDEATRIETELQDALKRRNAEIARKDAEIAAINRDIENTKAQIAAQEQEVWRRAAEIRKAANTAARIFPAFDASGFVHASDVRKEVVRRRFGDEAVAGKSEAYIDDRFEVLAERANADPFALVVADGLKSNDGKAESERAYNDYVKSLRDAHKDQTKH